MKYLKIFTDGGARGNPGPAATGFVIKDSQDKILFQAGKAIGQATNNQAEYQALIQALNWVKENQPQVAQIDFFLDSRLVVNQMSGKFKIKSPKMRQLWQKAKTLALSLKATINYHLIPREMNTQADSLLNQALEELSS
jgi:ribonuclease HI